jgi:hypothetical protein
MGANLWGESPLWENRMGLIESHVNHWPKARAGPRGPVWRKPESKCARRRTETAYKAEGVEASWHMTAKPTGSTPTVNAALVHRKFAFLPGEICTACGATGWRRYPDRFHRDTKTRAPWRAARCVSKKLAATSSRRTARPAAMRAVTVQKSAAAVVGAQASGH